MAVFQIPIMRTSVSVKSENAPMSGTSCSSRIPYSGTDHDFPKPSKMSMWTYPVALTSKAKGTTGSPQPREPLNKLPWSAFAAKRG